jgi:hypothetical protein
VSGVATSFDDTHLLYIAQLHDAIIGASEIDSSSAAREESLRCM